jgi:hypothetical protein
MDAEPQPPKKLYFAVGLLVLTTAWCGTLLTVRILFF